MKNLVAAVIVSLIGVSAMAQYYPGPVPPPRGGGGGYHGGPRNNNANEVGSILSAYTGALLLTSATACGGGPACAYREVIVDAKDDSAVYIATSDLENGIEGEKSVKFVRALDLLHEMDPSNKSSDYELAVSITNF